MPRAKQPDPAPVVLLLLDAQTFIVESSEQLLRGSDIEFDYLDTRLGDAMRKLAQVRSEVQEMRRAKLGLVTIGATG